MLSKVFEVFFRLSEQEFEDPRDADDAVYECNGKEMMGERWLAHSDFTKHWAFKCFSDWFQSTIMLSSYLNCYLLSEF